MAKKTIKKAVNKKKAVVKAKAAKKAVKKAVKKTIAKKSAAKAVKKAAGKKQTVAKKKPAAKKKSSSKKMVARKKTSVKKVASKKPALKKKAAGKKATAKKVVSKKATAKKTIGKKTVSKKKIAGNKVAVNKAVAKKKVSVKKAVSKKTIAKKVVPKKAVTKKKSVSKPLTKPEKPVKKAAAKNAVKEPKVTLANIAHHATEELNLQVQEHLDPTSDFIRLEDIIKSGVQTALKDLFHHELPLDQIALQPTKKEFAGTYTFVTFTLTRDLRKSPEEIANTIGTFLKDNVNVVSGYNVVKGFLNLEIADEAWGEVLTFVLDKSFAAIPKKHEKVIVEYSSPNTNKPLHLGHLRNNFLGYSVAEILKANGYDVTKVNLINDRGIHICKSMLAYLKFGNFETPDSSGIKGDHLIGKYYVRFNQEMEAQTDAMIRRWSNGSLEELPEEKIDEVRNLVHTLNNTNQEVEPEKYKGIKSKLKDIAEDYAQILKEAQQMLLKWEQGDHEIRQLWERMNAWVYEGFNATYEDIGVNFDKFYYESETYLLGKAVVQEGLDKGLFFRKEDNSVWVDFKDAGLDQKLLLRGDGTSVYITQDLGTADLKYNDYHANKSIYVVGNEQDYHFNVLKEIVKKLGRPYADGIYHLSYGMVDLPSGKMKSREGTVVDADELVMEMIETAEQQTQELGKIEGFSDEEARNLYKILGLGALKYFLLKVDPKKRMLFNPQESIEFQGNTGPFIQYTHARISAILRKSKQLEVDYLHMNYAHINGLHSTERDVIVLLNEFPDKLAEAARDYSPSVIAQYVYELAKEYNRFYAEVSIFNEEDKLALSFRIALSYAVAKVIRKAMALLGIQVPERM